MLYEGSQVSLTDGSRVGMTYGPSVPTRTLSLSYLATIAYHNLR